MPRRTRLYKHAHTRDDDHTSTTSDKPKDQNTPSYHSDPTTSQDNDLKVEKKELRQRQQAQTKRYNQSAKDPPSLSKGDVVRMKPFKLGEVLAYGPSHCKASRAVIHR